MELFKLFGTIMVDNKKANKSINSTSKEADGLGNKLLNGVKTVGKWGVALGAAATAAGAAIYGVAQKAAGTTDHIDKMSQKIGISREAYQELDFICSQSGTSVDKLQAGMKSLTAAMDGAKSGTASNVEQFQKLGVAVTNADGSFRSQEDVMWDTLVALQAMENQTEKARLASELFGRTGTELMPLLNGTSGSIEQMKQQAHDLGLVIEDEGIDAGVHLTDTIDQAKRSFDAIITRIGVGFMPIVQGALDLIIQNMPTIQVVLNAVFSVFNTVIKGVGSLFNYLKPIIQDLFVKLQIWWSQNGNTVMLAFQQASKTLYSVIKSIFPSIQSLVKVCFDVIKTVYNAVLKPVFNFLISNVLPNLLKIFKAVFPTIITLVKGAFSTIQVVWNSILKPVLNAIGAILKTIILPVFKTVFNTVSTVVSSAFSTINSIYKSVLKPCFNTISSALKVLKNTFSSIFGSIKSITTTIFNSVKSAMTNPIESAKKIISGIINAIKGFFNFKISWPKIPLPHFAVKPKGWGIGDLLTGTIPSLGIDWYAKAMDTGMILDKPTIFGAANGKLLGAGETGSETVVGTQSLMDMIKSASNDGNADLLSVLCQIRDYLADEDRWYRVMLRALTDGSLAIILDGREVGRIVRKYA